MSQETTMKENLDDNEKGFWKMYSWHAFRKSPDPHAESQGDAV